MPACLATHYLVCCRKKVEQLFLLCMQAAAQTERQNALGKLAELEGILQQALDQRAQASEEAHRSQNQLTALSDELSVSQQQLKRQQQPLALLQVSSALVPLLCALIEYADAMNLCCTPAM